MTKIIFYIPCFLLFFTSSIQSQTTGVYDITFTSIWNVTDHTTVPSGAHWSRLVGATHKTENTFLKLGELASEGIKNIAETGSNTVFNNEVTTAISNGEALEYINGNSLGSATGTIVITDLQVQKEHPLISLVSMIAPSPDWIIALNSYSLLDTNGDWKNDVTLDIFAYDAGTDSGTNYTSSNTITSPFQPISKISSAPFQGNKMGTIRILLKSVLGIDTINELDHITMYPNPTKGVLHLINDRNIPLKSVEIFSVLAGRVFHQNKKLMMTNTSFSLEDLNKGIYILRITTDKNRIKNLKLIIE